MPTATVRVSWVNAAPERINRRTIQVTRNGVSDETIELPPEITAYTLDIPASTNITVKTTVFDKDTGIPVESETATFFVGDLVDALPDTDFNFEILSVNPDPGPEPVARPTAAQRGRGPVNPLTK